MADTNTTNLNLVKPEVGASSDTWGTKINSDLDAIDGLFDAGPVLKVAKGGTGASTASGARTNLGLGGLAVLNAVGSTEITDGSVGTAELASGAVTTAKIGDGQVTTAKIANLAVTTAEIGDGQVTTAKIANLAVTTAELASSAVTTTKIADNAVSGSKIAMGSDAQGDILYYNGTDYARLAAGTSGQVLQTRGSGANPEWADVALGQNQTWQNVIGSRAVSTSYRNTTGRAIMVALSGGGGSGEPPVQVSSDNSTWIQVGRLGAGTFNSCSFVVPNNWYYRVNGSAPSTFTWAELR